MKTISVILWTALVLLTGALLDAVVTVCVFKAAGGCPMQKKE